jgi:hydroxymethylpyrimidine/phosphomethylpyrimidine kinase
MIEAELDALVARLGHVSTQHDGDGWFVERQVNPDGTAAAAAITALRAENARLREALEEARKKAEGNVHHHLIATAITESLGDHS